MIDLSQVSMRLKNSAYAMEKIAENPSTDIKIAAALIREMESNLEIAQKIDAEIAK